MDTRIKLSKNCRLINFPQIQSFFFFFLMFHFGIAFPLAINKRLDKRNTVHFTTHKGIIKKEMGHHHHHHHHHEGANPYDDPLLACCCCPCLLVSSVFSMFTRCIFMACYPFLQCLGWDEHRHHHHHHHHSHFL
ncbi:hypothetical protein RDI58_015161 [Solanum bulbocastanum]|uniref:Uncharacterized protein n=1 Tax=Solanum bulbocastanum TaxID=147425 RepID=A0AAN8TMS4_SOLBU